MNTDTVSLLREALQEFVNYHTVPAGLTLETVTDQKAFSDFIHTTEDKEKAMVAKAIAILAAPVAAIQPDGNEDFPSDLIGRLREYAGNPNYSHGDYADTMCQAADELSRPAASAPAQPEAKGEAVCGACHGSGWVVRDADIGTDQECFSCGGSGVDEDAAPVPAAPADKGELPKELIARVVERLSKAQIFDLAQEVRIAATANEFERCKNKDCGRFKDGAGWSCRAIRDNACDRARQAAIAQPSGAVPHAKIAGPRCGYEDSAYINGWNECRDAMLAAAPQPPSTGIADDAEFARLWLDFVAVVEGSDLRYAERKAAIIAYIDTRTAALIDAASKERDQDLLDFAKAIVNEQDGPSRNTCVFCGTWLEVGNHAHETDCAYMRAKNHIATTKAAK